MAETIDQFISEYEEIFNHLGYYPKGLIIPVLDVQSLKLSMRNRKEEIKMMKISEKNKERIMAGDPACICVSPQYFEEGDYTEWQDQQEKTANMPYDEYVVYLVKEMEEEYEYIVVHSDGCIYANKGGISHDISYNDFDDVTKFIELAEKYGIGEVEFA